MSAFEPYAATGALNAFETATGFGAAAGGFGVGGELAAEGGWPSSITWPKMAIHVNSEGAIAPVTMPMPGTPAGAAAVGSAPELLSGVACLVEARGISFQALFDGYDADGDARLSRRELAALVSDVMGPAGLRGLRYFQVLLDGDGDGFVTVEDLVGAARVLCAYSGPALVAKTNADVGDILVALALQTCIGSGIHWGMHVRTLMDSVRSKRTGKLEFACMMRLMRKLLPGLSLQEAKSIMDKGRPFFGTKEERRTSLHTVLCGISAVHPDIWATLRANRRGSISSIASRTGSLGPTRSLMTGAAPRVAPSRAGSLSRTSTLTATTAAALRTKMARASLNDTTVTLPPRAPSACLRMGTARTASKEVPHVPLAPLGSLSSMKERLAALGAERAFKDAAAHLEADTALLAACGSDRGARMAAIAALLAAASGHGSIVTQESLARASAVAGAALQVAGVLVGSLACTTTKASLVASAPMKALLSLLEDSPSVLQSAFAGRTQADPESAAAATAARHKLLLLGDLPAVLGEAVPTWDAATCAYAAQQLEWHASAGICCSLASPAPGDKPANFTFAELAAALCAAAKTEAAALCGRVPPAVHTCMVRLPSALAACDKLQEMWAAAGRPLSVTDAASLMVDLIECDAVSAAGASSGAKGWLAAALLPLVGMAPAGVDAAAAAVHHLQGACNAAQAAAAPWRGAKAATAESGNVAAVPAH